MTLASATRGIGQASRKIIKGSSSLLKETEAYLKSAGRSESEINDALSSLQKALYTTSDDIGKQIDEIYKLGKGADLESDLKMASTETAGGIISLKGSTNTRIKGGKKGKDTQDGTGTTETTPAARTSARKMFTDKIVNNPKTTLALLSVAGLTAYAVAAFTATDGKRFDITSIDKDKDGKLIVKFKPAPWPGDGPTIGWNVTKTDTIDFDSRCYFVNSADNPTHEIKDVILGESNSLTIDDNMSYSSTSASGNLGFFIVNTSFSGQFIDGVDNALNVLYKIIKDAVDIPLDIFCEQFSFLCGIDTGLVVAIIISIIVLCCSSSVAVVILSQK